MGAAVATLDFPDENFCKYCGEWNPKHCENKCTENKRPAIFKCKFCEDEIPHNQSKCVHNPFQGDDRRLRRCVYCKDIIWGKTHTCS